MKHVFKSLGNRKVVDLVPYLKEKLAERNDISVYIGSDSQNIGDSTVYACVIVLHYNKNGGHVLYTKSKIDRVKDRYTRLWNEIELSMEVARYLEAQGIQKAKYIDIDLNPDPKYASNGILRAALGFIESYGFVPRSKPDAMSASYCADRVCH
jgi:predicted RNase H-related nuclease YkuK (DUF458 family)